MTSSHPSPGPHQPADQQGRPTGDPATTACDVAGCQNPSAGTYLDASDARRFLFVVCAQHLERLKRGEQPHVVAEWLQHANMYGPPTLIMD